MAAQTGLPAPFVLEGSSWGGDDGNWSTFRLSLGTPAQYFDVLPFTSTSQIMVVSRSACFGSGDRDATCPLSRGAGFDPWSTSSAGFVSSTWEDIGENQFPSIGGYAGPVQGDFGTDNATLFDSTTGANATLQNQIIGLYNTSDIWLGGLGLDVIPTGNRSIPGLLSTLKSNRLIASLSFGYQAGSSSQSLHGRLVFGGYDASVYTPQNTTWYVSGNGAPLQVSVDGIFLNSDTSSVTVSNYTYAAIDSSTPYLWLPTAGCTAIADELQLGYNVTSGLWVANSSTLSRARAQNYSLAFTLDSNAPTNEWNDDGGITVNMPFSMFDMELSAPLGEDGTHYFPMKQLPDASANTIILGRSFLQAVYLIVDWERQNFTFSQIRAAPVGSANIQPITPLASPTTTTAITGPGHSMTTPSSTASFSSGPVPQVSKNRHSSWEVGTIVGVAVGVSVMIALGIWVRWMIVRKNRLLAAGIQEIEQRTPPLPPSIPGQKNAAAEGFASTTYLNGLHSRSVTSQAMSTEIHEMPAHSSHAELEAREVRVGRKPPAATPQDPSVPRVDCIHPGFGVPLNMDISWLCDHDDVK